MSYTRSWDDNIPAGTSQASTIDDSIRALRVDVHERMNDLVDGWVTGPLVLKTGVLGTLARTMVLGPHSGSFQDHNADASYVDDYVESHSSGPAYRIPLVLPVGAEITRVQYLVDKFGGSSITCKFKKVTFATSPVISELHTQLQTSNSGIQLLDTGTVAITVAVDTNYFFQFNGDFTYRVYGAKVYYNIAALNG